MNDWITDWSKIEDNKKYLVCPINSKVTDGTLYLGQPTAIESGWKVKRYMEKCYAALPVPEFKGIQ